MLLASNSYSYPVLGAFWTILMIFLWVIWFWVLITIFIDLFRSHDLSGWAKALWFIFILIFPLIGVLVYLIARGGKMHEHAARDAQLQEQQYCCPSPPHGSSRTRATRALLRMRRASTLRRARPECI